MYFFYTLFFNNFLLFNFKNMELQVFKNAVEMPDDYIPSLAEAEIECW
jgi:hypothetical protein